MKKTVFAALVLFAVTAAYAQTAVELNNSGAASYKSGNYDAAIADFTKAIKLDSKDAEHYSWRGLSYFQKKDWNRAISDLTQAIKLDQHERRYYEFRAEAYYGKKDYKRAIADYSEAIRLDPNHATAYNNRGKIYYDMKDYDRAIADYNKAIQLNPNSESPYINRAYAYCVKGNYADAYADVNKTLQLNPNLTEATSYLTAELRKKGYTVLTAQEQQAVQQAVAERNRPLPDDAFEVKQNLDNTITITKFKLRYGGDVVIPSTLFGLKVTIIGDGAFRGCELRSVVIPDTVTTIEREAFTCIYKDAGLTKVTLGKSVRTIGIDAFGNNKNLTEIIIPESVTEIGTSAFRGCSLTSVTFGRGLQTIGDYAFQENELTSVTIPANLKNIGGRAFYSNKIQSIVIPASFGSIESMKMGMFSYVLIIFGGNPITRATLPANISADGMENWGFEENLRNFYANQGRVAGTYVKNEPIWTRQ